MQSALCLTWVLAVVFAGNVAALRLPDVGQALDLPRSALPEASVTVPQAYVTAAP